jgi:hypothetical protein
MQPAKNAAINHFRIKISRFSGIGNELNQDRPSGCVALHYLPLEGADAFDVELIDRH